MHTTRKTAGRLPKKTYAIGTLRYRCSALRGSAAPPDQMGGSASEISGFEGYACAKVGGEPAGGSGACATFTGAGRPGGDGK